MSKKVLVTSALPYINNLPHLGHIVGCHLPADIFARFCRQKGYDVTFVGGSDEHGTPSVLAAGKAGKDVKDFVDELHEIHKEIYKKFNISYDIYSRTSSKEHIQETQSLFKDIDEKFLIEKEEEHFFSTKDNMFLPDRFIKGTCPACSGDANSDQCESCGKVLTVKELINPISVISGDQPILKKSKHLYLDLSMLSEALNDWLESKKDLFKPYVYSEAKKWINEGLRERSITRDMDWGVPVNREGFENKVFYVWFDAPIGYITFAKMLGKDWESHEVYHFLGKDNIPFHTIFWPGMLLASSKKLPYNVVGYNYLTFEGEKFSKSKNIGIFCNEIDESMDIDTVRFYLAHSLPESKDTDFRWDEYKSVVNSSLIGNVSNLFNRTLSMVNKYFDGSIDLDKAPFDEELKDSQTPLLNEIDTLFEQCEIRKGIKAILKFSSLGNEYIDKKEPWRLFKEDKEELKRVMYLLLDHIKQVTKLMYPIIPSKIEEFVEDQLKISIDNIKIRDHVSFPLKHKIGMQKPLFVRVE